MFLYPSSLKIAESKPGNCSTSYAVMTTQFLPLPFAEVCIVTFMFFNTGCYTNKFQRAPPAGWDMVTPCSGLGSVLHILFTIYKVSGSSTALGNTGLSIHSAHREKVRAHPLKPKGKLQPGRVILHLYVLLS